MRLGHLVLGEQGDVAGDLAGRRRRRRRARRPARRPGRGRCARAGPGRRGPARAASVRAIRRALSRQPGPRAGGPAVLDGEPVRPDRGEPVGRLVEGDHPAGRLEPERGRHGLAQQRPRRPSGCPGRSRARPAAASAAPRRSASSGSSARGATSIAAVSRMSWLVAPLWTNSPDRRAHGGAEPGHQRHHRVAARGRLGRQLGHVGTSSRRQAAAIPSAAAAGIRPGRRRRPGPARPRPRAARPARRRRPTAAAHLAPGQRRRTARRRRAAASGRDSDREENGLTLPLQADVEPVPVVRRRARSASPAGPDRHSGQDRVGRVAAGSSAK